MYDLDNGQGCAEEIAGKDSLISLIFLSVAKLPKALKFSTQYVLWLSNLSKKDTPLKNEAYFHSMYCVHNANIVIQMNI